MSNKVNSSCFIHHRVCGYFCAFSKCEVKIICQKCVTEHLKIHPRHFIYQTQNLAQVHAFDKLGRLKQTLGRQKLSNQERIKKIYETFDGLTVPLVTKVREFEKLSKDLILKQFLKFLAENKILIQSSKIIKSDATKTRVEPQIMIEEVIAEVGMIQDRESQLKENIEKFLVYVDSTAEMINSVKLQVDHATKNFFDFLDNCQEMQERKYEDEKSGEMTPFKQFFMNYVNNHRAVAKIQNNKIELLLLQYKKSFQMKEEELKMSKQQNMSLLARIEQLNKTIEQLKMQVLDFKSKQERQQRERKQAISIARQKIEETLIRNEVVLNQSRTISMQKKNLQIKYIDVLLDMVKTPVQIILSQHNLSKDQLHRFMYENQDRKISYKVVKILRMSFSPVDFQFLEKALVYFQNLQTLELNSCKIDDLTLEKLCQFFPSNLKHLHLIDNELTDDGIQKMLTITQKKSINFQSLFLSYNKLKPNSIDSIIRYCWDLRILHISKNQIKSKGVVSIAKGLKNLQQLFIGGTGVGKDGILSLCRSNFRLRRLSLVATDITTDIVSEIMLALPKLQWLDISYSNLPEGDRGKIEKIKSFNKNLQIILQT